jgi:sugar O-acyltransferase (sialic acid O-acetyltransferase NeuD family)
MKKIAVIGYGAFAREIICNFKYPFDIFFYGNYKFNLETIEKKHNCKCYDLNLFDKHKYSALVTITDGNERKNIVLDMPKNTSYYTYIDKNAILMDKQTIKIGEGSIICAGTILTTNLVFGNFTQLNLLTTVGHDTIVGNFCTTGPSVNISGNCNIGNNVYFGSNCTIKQKINIVDNVTIGLGSSVVKDIIEPGVYIGSPVKKLIK